MKGIRRFFWLIVLSVNSSLFVACAQREPPIVKTLGSEKKEQSESDVRKDPACAERIEDLLERIADHVVTGDYAGVENLTLATADIAALQDHSYKTDDPNVRAFDREMVEDAIKQFKEFHQNGDLTLLRIESGTRLHAAPIEAISPAANQVRDNRIVFRQAGKEKILVVGIAVQVGSCWKIAQL